MPNTITDIIKPELSTITAILSLTSDKDSNDLQIVAMQELNFLEQHAIAKPELLNVARGNPAQQQSILLAVKSVMRKNLTLDPSAGLVYVKTRKVNMGGNWVEVLELQETANGLLSYHRQFGRILDHTNPAIVKNENGRVVGVSMQILKPSPLGPRWEQFDYDESDFHRWATFSHKERSRGKADANLQTLNYANHLYRSWKEGIDPEFARAKCIRHTLKKLGTNPNEGARRPVAFTSPIDATTAMAETDDSEFTPHEEINTTINETDQSNGQPPAQAGFNENDL